MNGKIAKNEKGKDMGRYIDNVNTYLEKRKIKQTFVSVKTGIEVSKLSRLLTGNQDITSTDMEKIADALGVDVEYFLSKDFSVEDFHVNREGEAVFYVGEPSKEQEVFAMKLIDMIENVDEVLSARHWFAKMMED